MPRQQLVLKPASRFSVRFWREWSDWRNNSGILEEREGNFEWSSLKKGRPGTHYYCYTTQVSSDVSKNRWQKLVNRDLVSVCHKFNACRYLDWSSLLESADWWIIVLSSPQVPNQLCQIVTTIYIYIYLYNVSFSEQLTYVTSYNKASQTRWPLPIDMMLYIYLLSVFTFWTPKQSVPI
jgi:hypothetical protein